MDSSTEQTSASQNESVDASTSNAENTDVSVNNNNNSSVSESDTGTKTVATTPTPTVVSEKSTSNPNSIRIFLGMDAFQQKTGSKTPSPEQSRLEKKADAEVARIMKRASGKESETDIIDITDSDTDTDEKNNKKENENQKPVQASIQQMLCHEDLSDISTMEMTSSDDNEPEDKDKAKTKNVNVLKKDVHKQNDQEVEEATVSSSDDPGQVTTSPISPSNSNNATPPPSPLRQGQPENNNENEAEEFQNGSCDSSTHAQAHALHQSPNRELEEVVEVVEVAEEVDVIMECDEELKDDDLLASPLPEAIYEEEITDNNPDDPSEYEGQCHIHFAEEMEIDTNIDSGKDEDDEDAVREGQSCTTPTVDIMDGQQVNRPVRMMTRRSLRRSLKEGKNSQDPSPSTSPPVVTGSATPTADEVSPGTSRKTLVLNKLKKPQPNCLEMYIDLRKKIQERRNALTCVRVHPPKGFKDYLLNRKTYTLHGDPNAMVSPVTSAPPGVPQEMTDFYLKQENDRHKLRMRHLVEKEKLVLTIEQEILRVHGRAARSLLHQPIPLSACTILRDEEVYTELKPEQTLFAEANINSRSGNVNKGRQFLQWLQQVDDKFDKIKTCMLLRHHNESESLFAAQRMDFEWKLRELGIFTIYPNVDQQCVPLVRVPDDFNLQGPAEVNP